jgi:threonine dehydrogenase-like Zn-dependent dehydrogenase
MMGLAIARALFTTPPIVADIDAEKRNAALAAGAAAVYDPSDPQTRKAVMAATGGGVLAICWVPTNRCNLPPACWRAAEKWSSPGCSAAISPSPPQCSASWRSPSKAR